MFQWLIVHTVVTAALICIVLTANRCFRLGPAARHLLWLAVLVKFLTPPVVYWPWALPTLKPTPQAAAPDHIAVRTVIIDMPPDPGRAEPDATEASPQTPAIAPPVVTAPAAPPFSWDWLPSAACWTWLAGGILVALRQGMRILRWHRRLARGTPAPESLESLVRELAASIALRAPRLIVLRCVASPMVWCFGTPRLLWPSGLEDRLSAEGCRAVLLHELAHLRRRDHWVGWLMLIGGCVWWWHPLLWYVRRRLGQEAELACDAYVVGAAPDARRAYARALLEVSQRMAAAVAVPALGATGGRRDLERRLVMIMRGPASRRVSWVGLAGAIALGLLALPAWTLGEDKTAQPPGGETPPAPTVTAAPAGAAFEPVTLYRYSTTAVPVTTYRLIAAGAAPATPPTPAAPEPVAAQPAAPGSNASKDPALPALMERDRKLKDLEDKIQQLLKEMQQLRGQAPPGGTNNPLSAAPPEALLGLIREAIGSGLVAPAAAPQPALITPTPSYLAEAVPTVPVPAYPAGPGSTAPVPAYPAAQPVLNESNVDVITLTRVTYKLKAATAEALAAFLKENVKTAILEIKNEGDSLIVTTTPEAQHVIGQLINLIQGKKSEATMLYRPAGATPMPALPGGTSAPPWPKYIGPPVAK